MFPFLESFAHFVSDLSLEIPVDRRHKEFVEVGAAHRTGHAILNYALVALEAHEMLAGGEHRLCAKLIADQAFIVVPLRTHDFSLLITTFLLSSRLSIF